MHTAAPGLDPKKNNQINELMSKAAIWSCCAVLLARSNQGGWVEAHDHFELTWAELTQGSAVTSAGTVPVPVLGLLVVLQPWLEHPHQKVQQFIAYMPTARPQMLIDHHGCDCKPWPRCHTYTDCRAVLGRQHELLGYYSLNLDR